MKKYILLLALVICTALSSCGTEAIPKEYVSENVDGLEVSYKRFSMVEPYEWEEKSFWLMQNQRDEIYEDLSKLEFKKFNENIGFDGRALDEIVVMLWNNQSSGLAYYFYNGNVYYQKYSDWSPNPQNYVAEDSYAIVEKLRKWTVKTFPELNNDFEVMKKNREVQEGSSSESN